MLFPPVVEPGSLSLIARRRLSTIVCLALVGPVLLGSDAGADEVEEVEEVVVEGAAGGAFLRPVIGARRELAVAVVAVLKREDRSSA